MSEEQAAEIPWNTPEGRLSIYRKVMKYLYANPGERARCLDFACAREIVLKATGMDIPQDARVLFLPEKDNLRGKPRSEPAAEAHGAGGIRYNSGSSLVVTLPPADMKPDDPRILAYACSYIIWDQ